MRYLTLVFISFYFISCTKEIGRPSSPPNNIDTTITDTHYKFGKIIQWEDSLKIYDADSGKLIVGIPNSNDWVNSYVNNITIDDSLMYQPTTTNLLALKVNSSQIQFNSFFSLNSSQVTTCFPIISGDSIFTSAFNSIGQLMIFCLNKITGNIIWTSDTQITVDTEPYFPSLVATADKLFINLTDGPACFNKSNGKLVWRNNNSGGYTINLNLFPLIASQKMIVCSFGAKQAYCFDINSGSLIWTANLPYSPLNIEMHLVDSTVIVISGASSSNAGFTASSININTGTVTNINYSAVFVDFDENYLYATTNPTNTTFPKRINKYDMVSGNLIWYHDFIGGLGGGVGQSSGFVPTSNYIYCTETDSGATYGEGLQKMTILSKQTGITLKSFPIYSDVYPVYVVLDSANNFYHTIKFR